MNNPEYPQPNKKLSKITTLNHSHSKTKNNSTPTCQIYKGFRKGLVPDWMCVTKSELPRSWITICRSPCFAETYSCLVGPFTFFRFKLKLKHNLEQSFMAQRNLYGLFLRMSLLSYFSSSRDIRMVSSDSLGCTASPFNLEKKDYHWISVVTEWKSPLKIWFWSSCTQKDRFTWSGSHPYSSVAGCSFLPSVFEGQRVKLGPKAERLQLEVKVRGWIWVQRVMDLA